MANRGSEGQIGARRGNERPRGEEEGPGGAGEGSRWAPRGQDGQQVGRRGKE